MGERLEPQASACVSTRAVQTKVRRRYLDRWNIDRPMVLADLAQAVSNLSRGRFHGRSIFTIWLRRRRLAPSAPHGAVGTFDLPSERRGVAQRRCVQARPQ